jgi:hypothetical protein
MTPTSVKRVTSTKKSGEPLPLILIRGKWVHTEDSGMKFRFLYREGTGPIKTAFARSPMSADIRLATVVR